MFILLLITFISCMFPNSETIEMDNSKPSGLLITNSFFDGFG